MSIVGKKTKLLLIATAVFVLTVTFLIQQRWFEESVDNRVHVSSNQVAPSNTVPTSGKTPSQNASSTTKQKNDMVAKSALANKELPPLFTDREVDLMLSGFSANQVYQQQDKLIRTYPLYSEVHVQLSEDLAIEIDFENLPTQELVKHALDMREKFWNYGGNLSSGAYIYAYKARTLLELAYSRDPNNLSIADELVETIQSTHPRWTLAEDNPNKKIINTESQKRLLDIRTKQVEQIQKEIENGRKPNWQDFARTCDLSILLATEKKDFEQAKQLVEWQIKEAVNGNWTDFLEPLQNSLNQFSQGKNSYFNIYKAPVAKENWPNEFRYGRRLPAFKGPDPEERGIVPISRLNSDLNWISSEDLR